MIEDLDLLTQFRGHKVHSVCVARRSSAGVEWHILRQVCVYFLVCSLCCFGVSGYSAWKDDKNRGPCSNFWPKVVRRLSTVGGSCEMSLGMPQCQRGVCECGTKTFFRDKSASRMDQELGDQEQQDQKRRELKLVSSCRQTELSISSMWLNIWTSQ